jgi:hypothetical protein
MSATVLGASCERVVVIGTRGGHRPSKGRPPITRAGYRDSICTGLGGKHEARFS